MIRVQLEKFEGPLALLLHLIRKNEMDVYDIEIHKITSQYLEYITVMKELDLEVAGDFVAMAATLIHIKSKMLLPTYDEDGEVVESEDPRAELVQRLLEYQKFQDAAKQLGGRPLLGKDLWKRPIKEAYAPGDVEIILEDGGLFPLISNYRRAMKAMKKKVHVVFKKAQSVASRVMELKNYLVVGNRIVMSDLMTDEDSKNRSKLVITFLSVLELGKLGFVRIFQNENYGPIHMEVRKVVEGEIIAQMEDYDTAKGLEESMMDAPLANIAEAIPASNEAHLDEALGATDEEILAAEDELELDELSDEIMADEVPGRHQEVVLEADNFDEERESLESESLLEISPMEEEISLEESFSEGSSIIEGVGEAPVVGADQSEIVVAGEKKEEVDRTVVQDLVDRAKKAFRDLE